jgi:hypothetical protein
MPDQSPRVFVSHASEDKQRFVISFAQRLRAKGIDAWVDMWEIRPGDSLVEKIFEEGIGRANAVIVVLSKCSVGKRWVREELDSAVVTRIQKKSRLIPVIIEECEIPVSLQHLAHVRVDFPEDIERAVDQIARALFDATAKPELGKKPAYVRSRSGLSVPGLEQSDLIVLSAVGDIWLEKNESLIDRDELLRRLVSMDLNEQLSLESLSVLDGEGYIRGQHAIGEDYVIVELTGAGAEVIAKNRFPDFAELERQIAAFVVNAGEAENHVIAETLSIPKAIVDHVLLGFQAKRLVKLAGPSIGGYMEVYDVSPRLRRAVSA